MENEQLFWDGALPTVLVPGGDGDGAGWTLTDCMVHDRTTANRLYALRVGGYDR